MLPSTHASRQAGEHRDVINELADELHFDSALVAEVYWNELDALKRSARLQDYVPVFAARRTADRLRRIKRSGR